ncbi:MAG: ASCH domain-containing protein [Pseudomonadota bacterium]
MSKPLHPKYPEAETFTFGDSRGLCEELLALVRSGEKTATCGALRDFQSGGEAMPVLGRRDIALDWDGQPALVIETTSVAILRYCDVPEEFALAEGEGTFDFWKTAHREYFTRNGGFDPEMELVCERFKLVEVLA